MGRPVVPVGQMERRLPPGGRIRIGTSTTVTGRGRDYKRPEKLDRFRFTSRDQAAIEEIAALHGGTVERWDGSPDGTQHQVVTEATEIPILLPPDPLGGTPVYEMWEAGGCIRRCDGVQAQVPRPGPDGMELGTVGCLCAAAGELSCKVTTRLSVLLPNVRFGGAWMLETHGFHAAAELPGMVDVVQDLQSAGISRALLAVEKRRQVVLGKVRDFMVPVIRLGLSPDDVTSGRALVAPATRAAIEVGGQRALPTGLPGGDVADEEFAADFEDDVVDVEVVEPDEPASPAPTPLDGMPAADGGAGDAAHRRLMATLREAGIDDDQRHLLAGAVSGGRTSSSRELTAGEVEQLQLLADLFAAGHVTLGAAGPERIDGTPLDLPLDVARTRAWLRDQGRPEQPPPPEEPPS